MPANPITDPPAALAEFVTYVGIHLTGDEKGEAADFLDHLFRALGHAGSEVMAKMNWSLRDLYRTLEEPGSNSLRDAQAHDSWNLSI